ncbi:alcohol dehydrogenase catalytic domain-containing protein [Nocardia sp. FBN12]|uniref:alcohol dehydrogenase catalytic domain-containing protein n=1 Tax=Nocardia sp. FBN12 TaxID=3419766 RepID=UPI003D04C784
MAGTMQAYRILEWGRPPEVVDVPIPEPGPGEVVVRVAGCGLCHSDLGMMQMPREVCESLGWQVPFTLGHETAGWVAALGAGVTSCAEGDPVAVVSPSSCGECSYCIRGQDNCCPKGLAGRGYGRDGGLAEFVRVSSPRGLIRLSGLDPRTAGTLTDAGATAFHGVRRVVPRITPGGVVVVIGAGGLGSFALQYLRHLTTAQVVVIDTDATRRAVAMELGAHNAIAQIGASTAETIRAMSAGGLGADAVLDFVGTDSTIAAGIAATRAGGAFALIGAAGGKLDAAWFDALPKDGEIFTFQGSTISDAHDVIRLAEAGAIRNDVETYTFDQVGQAYRDLEAGGLRGRAVVVLDDR